MKYLLALLTICLLLSTPNSVFAQRGCCSWHDGISHCDTSVGRYVCNDGTYSPTCGCYKAPPVIREPEYIPATNPPYPTDTPMPEEPEEEEFSLIVTPNPEQESLIDMGMRAYDNADPMRVIPAIAALSAGWGYYFGRSKKS